MSDEKMKILEMIEQKIISPEEGLKLLTAVETPLEPKAPLQPKTPNVNVKTPKVRILNEEELEEALEDALEEIEDLAEEIEDEVEELIEEIEDSFEDMTDEVNIEDDLEDQIQFKVDEIKAKANELKDKFMSEFNIDEDELRVKFKFNEDEFGDNFTDDHFKDEMRDWKNSFKFEMKSLNKEARRFGKEMSRLGKETAQITRDIVSDVISNIDVVTPEKMGKEFNEKDFVMEDDKEVKSYNLAQEFSLDCDGKTDISIVVISTDVTIITENREDVLVNYIKYNPKDEDLYRVVVEEDAKKIRITEKKSKGQSVFNFNFSGSGKKLLIRLPHKYKESLSINTVSGDLDINYLDSDFFKFSSVSGDMSADIIYSVNSLIKTTSGDCRIDLFRGNMMYSSVSGDIDLAYEILDGDFTMKSVSGDASMKLPKNSEFEVVAKTMSGDLNCNFPITYVGSKKKGKLRGQVGSDAHLISAVTTSGDLIIKKY